jgi:hypothetical protein
MRKEMGWKRYNSIGSRFKFSKKSVQDLSYERPKTTGTQRTLFLSFETYEHTFILLYYSARILSAKLS